MRKKLFALLLAGSFLLVYCSGEPKSQSGSTWVSPEIGRLVNLGDTVNLQINSADGADSVVYFADGERIAASEIGEAVTVGTDKFSLGIRSITAKIYRNGEAEEITTNIVVKSPLVPTRFSYTVVREFPHDTASYTQGLEYVNGVLFESDGLVGESSIRKTDPSSGRVLQVTNIPDVFAEGITVIGDKVLMLTYTENQLLEFSASDLKLLRQFPSPYQRQGWGLCNDGKNIYNSDGTNIIHVLNMDNYTEERSIEVYDNNGAVSQLNELEFIGGSIYANIYNSNRIVIINPANGQVTGELDLSNLYPDDQRAMKDFDGFVLNGIAWDAGRKRLFVTGKKWDKMFEIRISNK